MQDFEELLDLLELWDETDDHDRVTPEEFCRHRPELLEEFRQVLLQRTVMTQLLNGENSPSVGPEAMIERLQGGRYPVIQFHDKGGLGWVYLARDRELERTVALKCMQPEPATDSVARQRFRREARITARLEHPGVVPVYGLGSLPSQDSPYYAMRFVEGETLRHAIRTLHESGNEVDWRGIAASRILRSFVTVCETVAFAHSRGVIHRDLKSANIMVGAYGETLVLDWGLATLAGDGADDAEAHAPQPAAAVVVSPPSPETSYSVLSQPGAALGTVSFMSPEQAHGQWDQVTTSSDVFSLGAILYQVLTNQSPYSGADALELARACRYIPPLDVSPGVPKGLAAICVKAMQAQPALRYRNALELKNDIERFLVDEPVSVRRDTVYERLLRTLRKHRSAVQVGGFMALAAIVMLAVFLSLSAQKNVALKLAYDNENSARAEALQQRNLAEKALIESVYDNYGARMGLVSQALADRQPERLATAIRRAGPSLDSPVDARGVEWWLGWNLAHGHTRPVPFRGDLVVGMRLVDRGRKALMWTSAKQLLVIDTQTGRQHFQANISGTSLSIWNDRPADLPCSDDGGTLAIHKGAEIQIFALENDQFVLKRTISQGSHVFTATLSRDGKILVSGDGNGVVHLWELHTDQKRDFRINQGQAVTRLTLSGSGRYLAYFQTAANGSQPAVLDLVSGRIASVPDNGPQKFSRLSFGDHDTLLAWNQHQVTTFAVASSDTLKELWQTDLTRLFPDGARLNPSESIREWITTTEEAKHLDSESLRDRIHSGDPDRLVRATTLAIMHPRSGITSEIDYRRIGYRVFHREVPAGSSRKSAADARAGTAASVTPLTNPNLEAIVDFSRDGSCALIRNADQQYSTMASEAWSYECLDRHQSKSQIQRVAWTPDAELLSISGSAFSHVDSQGELDRCRSPFGAGDTALHKPVVWLPSSNTSEDLSVLAHYRENRIFVERITEPAASFQFQYSAASSTFPNDTISVRVFPWNSGFDKGLRHRIEKLPVPALHSPLALPWVLCVPKYEQRPPAGSDEKNRILIVDYEAERVVQELQVSSSAVRAAYISSTGRNIFVVCEILDTQTRRSSSSELHTWTISDDFSVTKGPIHPLAAAVRVLCCNPAGTQVALGTLDGRVLVVALSNGDVPVQITAHEGLVRAMTYTKDGQRLISAGEDQTVRLFSCRDWQEVMKFDCQSQPTCVAMDRDHRFLAIGDEAGHIAVLKAATRGDVYGRGSEWLRQPGAEALGESAILSEVWAEFITLFGRSGAELAAGRSALEAQRPLVREVSVDEFRKRFANALPPVVDDFLTGEKPGRNADMN